MAGLTVLLLGCGDLGSAVAHRLFRLGARVLVCDVARPAHSRRGMAFIDAFFDGTALLEGVAARLAADVQAIKEIWDGADAIAVTALAEAELVQAFRLDALVDATMPKRTTPRDRRAFAASCIGLGPGFIPQENCHVAIETRWGPTMGDVLSDRPSERRAGGPLVLDGMGRERFVCAEAAGRWRTAASLGQRVAAGELIGMIDAASMRASLSGTLRGLTHDEVDVLPGQRLIEIDPREAPQVFGLGERPRAVAEGVARALALDRTR